ncbi:MAG: SUMF1/EgtB/PvdO family nonheme iron enzyme [Pedobacter sp.]|nr:SUMF1/EgtB/PvdO family nonheme iron enzyme [Pedobacter sp.]
MYVSSLKILISVSLIISAISVFGQETNSVGMKLVNISQGEFLMGSPGYGEDFDEAPAHVVGISKNFKMSSTEVTNAQYELFDPKHKSLRGKDGISKNDNEAVVFVTYNDAVAFCVWLSKKEGKPYRLPTEAEWEYTCRAETLTEYNTGNKLSPIYQKNQETVCGVKQASLEVAKTPANQWGVFDMHGNVEEWCSDWYGSYHKEKQTDPIGFSNGLFRVTRGGSYDTPVRYLRSANRMAMIPSDKSYLVGFRVLQGALPNSKAEQPSAQALVFQNVNQPTKYWRKIVKPIFLEPQYYIHEDKCSMEVPIYSHNHCPAITWCPNGDLLAIWFSTNDEAGREMQILGSRLRSNHKIWDNASLFFKVPDRNMTGSSLLYDGKKTLYYMNGIEAAGSWQNLAVALRESQDNGATWSAPKMIAPEHEKGNQVIAGMLKSKEGWLIQPVDATPWGEGGSLLHISKNGGKHWTNPADTTVKVKFEEGATGNLIAGIHAGVVQLKNGDLMAFGRGNSIPSTEKGTLRMPISISTDMGKTWSYHSSEFNPIAGGQRLVLRRLNEGPLLLISFTNHPDEKDPNNIGMMFKDENGKVYKGHGMFAALSYDEGKTWPIKRLIVDGNTRFLNGGAWTGAFKMDDQHAEPRGYLAATQTPDNMIHLISSAIHYQFNLQWLTQKKASNLKKTK